MLMLPLKLFAESENFPFFIQYGFHEKECEMHGHEDFSELVIVLDGHAQHIVDNESYAISKGDVFVIDQYTHHSYIEAENFKICNIMFQPERLFRNIFHLRQNAGFQALFILEPYYTQNNLFRSRLKLHPDDFASVRKIIDQMMHEYTVKRDCWETMVYCKFLQLCVILSRLYEACSNEESDDILKLAAAVAYLEKHFCDNISIPELAQISGYSERQFSRLFKSAFSTTPNTHLITLRMQKAQQLIKNSDMSICEIAWSCGYDDQNYFSRVFKRYVGLTPTEYKHNVLW